MGIFHIFNIWALLSLPFFHCLITDIQTEKYPLEKKRKTKQKEWEPKEIFNPLSFFFIFFTFPPFFSSSPHLYLTFNFHSLSPLPNFLLILCLFFSFPFLSQHFTIISLFLYSSSYFCSTPPLYTFSPIFPSFYYNFKSVCISVNRIKAKKI